MDVREFSDQLHRIQQEIDTMQGHVYESFVPRDTLLGEMQARLAALLEELRKAAPGSQVDAGASANSHLRGVAKRQNEVSPHMVEGRPDGRGYDRWAQQQMAELTRANATLQADIMASKSTEAQLRAALHEKEALLKEIHHRVKNNMQIISSLLSLQSESITDACTLAMLKETQRRIRSMALVHQQLYQSGDLGSINVAEYIQKLIADLTHAYGIDSKRISVKLHVPSIFWRIDTAIPCGLILTELISNAFKHAFPDGRTGEIDIDLDADPQGSIMIRICDNGIGFPLEWDGRKNESLGLQLVSILIDQLDGMIQLETHGGTTIYMSFPVLQPPERA